MKVSETIGADTIIFLFIQTTIIYTLKLTCTLKTSAKMQHGVMMTNMPRTCHEISSLVILRAEADQELRWVQPVRNKNKRKNNANDGPAVSVHVQPPWAQGLVFTLSGLALSWFMGIYYPAWILSKHFLLCVCVFSDLRVLLERMGFQVEQDLRGRRWVSAHWFSQKYVVVLLLLIY